MRSGIARGPPRSLPPPPPRHEPFHCSMISPPVVAPIHVVALTASVTSSQAMTMRLYGGARNQLYMLVYHHAVTAQRACACECDRGVGEWATRSLTTLNAMHCSHGTHPRTFVAPVVAPRPPPYRT